MRRGWTRARFLVLPVLISVIAGIGSSARWYRTIFLEEIPGLRAHRARQGLSELAVLFRHVLRNALIPILTGVVVVIPLLFMGSLLVGVLLRHPRPGQLHDRRHQRAGLRGGARDGVHRLGALHRGTDPHRPVLHPGRPAGGAAMIFIRRDPRLPARRAVDRRAALRARRAGAALGLARAYPAPTLRPGAGGAAADRDGGGHRAARLLAVGLVDSLHYRPLLSAVERVAGERCEAGSAPAAPVVSTEVLSALDALLAPLRLRTEDLPAPFAWTLYQRETVETADGGQVRDYPRLATAPPTSARTWPPHAVATWAAAGEARSRRRRLAWLVAFLMLASLVWRGSGCAGRGGAGDARRAYRAGLARGAGDAGGAARGGGGVRGTGAALHVLGTDKGGQDVLYLALKSVRTALVIGTLTTLVMMPFAVALGIAAATSAAGWMTPCRYVHRAQRHPRRAADRRRGADDAGGHRHQPAVVRHRDRALRTRALLALCFILGITSWTRLARLLRGETLKAARAQYVQAARAFGVRTRRSCAATSCPTSCTSC